MALLLPDKKDRFKPDWPVIDWTNPLTRGLVFDLPLFEGNGMVVNDLVNHGQLTTSQTLAASATQPFWGSSPFGPAMWWPGSATDAFSGLLHAQAQLQHEITIEFMAYVTAGSTNGLDVIANVADAAGTTENWAVRQDLSTNSWAFEMGWGNNPGWGSTNGSIKTNAWQHVVVSLADLSDATKAPIFTIDGKLQNSYAFAVTPTGSPILGAQQINVGCFFPQPTLEGAWNGAILYVRFWNTVLTLQQIRNLRANPFQIYQYPLLRSVAKYISFGGSTVLPTTGNSTIALLTTLQTATTANSTVALSATLESQLNREPELTYDGSQNYLNLGTMGSFGSDMANGFYMEFDIQSTSSAIGEWGQAGSSHDGPIITFNEGTSNNNVAGNIGLFLTDSAGLRLAANATGTNVYDGKTHHIVITATPATNTITISIDYIPQTVSYYFQETPATFPNFDQNMLIGARIYQGSAPGNFFSAKVGKILIGQSRGNLYGKYFFEETQGTTTADTSGHGNTGTLTGSAPPSWGYFQANYPIALSTTLEAPHPNPLSTIKPKFPFIQINKRDPLTVGLVFDLPILEALGTTILNDLAGVTSASILNGASLVTSPFGPSILSGDNTNVTTFFSRATQNQVPALTIEAIIFPTGAGVGGDARIIHKGASTKYFDLAITATNKLELAAGWGNAQSESDWDTNAPMQLNTWLHVFVTYSWSDIANVPTFYVNRVLYDSALAPGAIVPAGSPNTDTTDLGIGNRPTATSKPFVGQIALVRYWNRILQQPEMVDLWTNPWRIYEQPLLTKYGNKLLYPNAATTTQSTVALYAPLQQYAVKLIDDFNAGYVASRWNQSLSTGTITFTAGQVQFGSSTSLGYNDLISVNSYDFRNSSAFVQVVNAGNQAIVSLEAILYVEVAGDGTNKVYWTINNGSLTARKVIANTNTQVATTTYDPTVHKWLRIRESAGTVFWDYSTDGFHWTNFTSLADPINFSVTQIALQEGTYANEGSTSTVIFDNFNVLENNNNLALKTTLETAGTKSTVALKTTLETAKQSSTVALKTTLETAGVKSTVALKTTLETAGVKSTVALKTILETAKQSSTTALKTTLETAGVKSTVAIRTTLETAGVKSTVALRTTLETAGVKSTVALRTTLETAKQSSTVALRTTLETAGVKSTVALKTTLETSGVKSTVALKTTLETTGIKSTVALRTTLSKPASSTVALLSRLEATKNSTVALKTTLETSGVKSTVALKTTLETAGVKSTVALKTTLETAGIKSTVALKTTLETTGIKSTVALKTTLETSAKFSTVALKTTLEAPRKSTVALLTTLESAAKKSTVAILTTLSKPAQSTVALLSRLEATKESTVAILTTLANNAVNSTNALLTILEANKRNTLALKTILEVTPQKSTVALRTTLSKPASSTVALLTFLEGTKNKTLALLTTLETTGIKSTVALKTTLETAKKPSTVALRTTLETAGVKSTVALKTTLETAFVTRQIALLTVLERITQRTVALKTNLEAKKNSTLALFTNLSFPINAIQVALLTTLESPKVSTLALKTSLERKATSCLALSTRLESTKNSTISVYTILERRTQKTVALFTNLIHQRNGNIALTTNLAHWILHRPKDLDKQGAFLNLSTPRGGRSRF